MSVLPLAAIIFFIAVIMTMTGRGGGNFYVLALVLSGIGMHESATTGQFILFISAFSASLIFGKNRTVEWKLFILIGGISALCAFFGGFFSHYLSGKLLKFVFSFFLLLAALLMLRPVKEKKIKTASPGWAFWKLKSGKHEYIINLKISVPIIMVTGFGSGMVGVSGGSFLVPLMVLACQVPMKIAVGTSTTMVATTALMGFLGHTFTGHFNLAMALPLALAAAAGGFIGGKTALKTKPAKLKLLFAVTTLAASFVMIFNAVLTT